MKKIIVITTMLLSGIGLRAQDIQLHVLDSILNKPYEFSALDIRNDTIFLVTENCNTIFYVNQKTKKVIQKDYYQDLGEDSDLEGISIYKHYIFLADEHDNSIKYIDMNTKTVTNLLLSHVNEVQNKNHDFGLEGICVSKTGEQLYILKELNKKFESEIYCYNLILADNHFFLAYDKTITVQLDRQHRYTDLQVSEDGKKIYLLRSKIGNYNIDTVTLQDNKLSYNFVNLPTIDITKAVDTYKKLGYSSNMEGLTINGNSFFVISDNFSGRNNHCDDPVNFKSKTLLLEVKDALTTK
ncbi:esterase-like activity of phytase family protein [Neptunitalea lumnitzerae]|uniref:Phytase-like domain-containing protein n=1 Tax=Neptunitalea lumnitzerae TaxID=2965509 RepID=A0ABQ5MIQ5_9FLAO|nr:esterase-like activity of phytase family protein [Neptunitalea sp. Y10]GLB49263.1 hypothetical protein Y10_16310 [Neptunitalea sp. Y10]